MSRMKLGLALGLLLLLGLVISAPARLLTYVLPQGQVVMQGLSGTLWSGRAGSCLLAVSGAYLHLGEVSWRLSPLSLLLFSPELSLESRWGSQQFSGRVVLSGANSFSSRDIEASVPASLAQQFMPVVLEGKLSARFEHLRVEQGLPVAASGSLVWQNALWSSPQGRVPLGSYALELEQDEDGPLSGEIITLAGPIQAEGLVELHGRSYRIDALLSGEDDLDSQLQQALSLVAAPEGQGFRVRLGGEI